MTIALGVIRDPPPVVNRLKAIYCDLLSKVKGRWLILTNALFFGSTDSIGQRP